MGKQNIFYYFAYGSNLSISRLTQRTPSAVSLGRYHLSQHTLRFHKKGQDGSAKCDAFYTGLMDHEVIGAVYEIAVEEKLLLDRIEGLGEGYLAKKVLVKNTQEQSIEAMTYYACDIDESLKPFSWYQQHVLTGAHEHHFPENYIQEISRVEAIEDPDLERNRHERFPTN